MKDETKPDAAAVANGEALKPTPALLEMIRKRFPPEGKAERVARAMAAWEEFRKNVRPFNLTAEQWKYIAEDDDLADQYHG